MKLLRLGEVGRERPAILDAEGAPRDLSSHLRDIDGDWLQSGGLEELRGLDPRALPRIAGTPRIGCPVAGIRKFICVGLNYRDHAAEAGMPPRFLRAGDVMTVGIEGLGEQTQSVKAYGQQ
jgi:2,4-diketo-3-deoxy-L-fuconate hydrolase